MTEPSSKTRVSLYYLASYLLLGGVGLVADPRLALQLLMATGDYGQFMPRLAGGLMIVLGIFIVQTIRFRLEALYPTTLVARAILLTIILWLYVTSQDVLFAVLLGIVGFGFVLTSAGYLLDRSRGVLGRAK